MKKLIYTQPLCFATCFCVIMSASLAAYGYDASNTANHRQVAIDIATSVFGFTVIMDRLIELSDAIEPSIEKSNMSDDIVWYKDMLRIYGLEVNTRYEKYKKYD